MVSIQVLATPISGLRRSSSVKPMALNIERDGARSRPSVIPRLRCLRSIEVKTLMKDYNRGEDSGRTAHENGQTIKINKKTGILRPESCQEAAFQPQDPQ